EGDELEGYWKAIIWGSLLVPCIGGWVIVVLSSVMYYVWRKPLMSPRVARRASLVVVLALALACWGVRRLPPAGGATPPAGPRGSGETSVKVSPLDLQQIETPTTSTRAPL